MAKRKFLALDPNVVKIVDDEVIKRNKNLSTGERKHTQKSVGEEAIMFWSKRDKNWDKKA